MCVRKSSSVYPFKGIGKREKLSLMKFLNQLVEHVQLVLVVIVWEKNLHCNHTAWADGEWKRVIWTKDDESVIKVLEKNPNYCTPSSSACISSKEKGKQERLCSKMKDEGKLGKFHTLRPKNVYRFHAYPVCCHDLLLCSHFQGQGFPRNCRCLGLLCSVITRVLCG